MLLAVTKIVTHLQMVSFNENEDILCKVSDFGESLVVAMKASGRAGVDNPTWCAPGRSALLTSKLIILRNYETNTIQ